MKVLFIDVPFGVEDIGGKTGNFKGLLNVIPALGLAYLAAVAERDGHEVHILDCARGLGFDAIEKEGRTFRPDVVGISATTPTFRNAVRAAEILRAIVPDAVYVVGGSHPTAMPDHAAKASVFDFLVLGEGENTFVELLRHIEGKGPVQPDDIPGLAFVRDGKLVITKPRKRITDLDALPFPARHLLPPLSAYSPCPASYRKLPLAHIMTSRGCPSVCNFCDRAIFGSVFKARSPENVLAEVEEVLSKYGAKEIRFFDDTFTYDKERLARICDGLKRFRPHFPWTCLTKVRCVDLNTLKMMHDAGCWQVLYGIESGDDGILKSINKHATVEENRNAIRWANQAGIGVRADFLVGTPDETLETLQKTLDFALETRIDFAHFNKFVPFPGTEFYRRLVAEGYTFDFDQPSSTLDHDAMLYVPPAIPEDVYRNFLDNAYRKFYFRPTYLLRRLLSMRTPTQLRANFMGAFSVGGAFKTSDGKTR